MKKFTIFFICVPLVYSELHRFMTAYTAINGQTAAGIPEFSAVTTLDEKQIYYNDSDIKKLIPKQNWMEEFASTDLWQKYIKIREKLLQIYKINIPVLMKTFNQSDGVHTCQWMYGCEWDDETEESHGFDLYGYDGEDFIFLLDLKENRYITSVPQGILTVMKWNKDREYLKYLKQYYDYKCVSWLKEFLHLSKATDPPEVSLLQKKQDYYVECHVTGFLFRNTSISWRKNGQALSDSSKLKSGDTLPNEDGTFQRRVTLYALPDEWREDQYTCVVEHKSLTESIQKILTEDQIKRNKSASDASYIMYLVIVIILVIVGLIGLSVLWKRRKELKYCKPVYIGPISGSPIHGEGSKKTAIYFKSKPSADPQSQDSLLPTPSNECSSPPEACDAETTTYSSKSTPSQEHAPAQKPLTSTLSNESTSSTETCDSRVSGAFMIPHGDEQYPSPELHLHSSSPVDRSPQTYPTTESFYKGQETSKDF